MNLLCVSKLINSRERKLIKPDRCKNRPVGAAPHRDIGPGAGLLQGAIPDFTCGAFQEAMQYVDFIL
jgi:hypothetical protein